MPRTWGYIIIVAALVVGGLALLLPVPESVEVTPAEAPKTSAPAVAPAPRPPAARARGPKTEPGAAPAPAVPVPKAATPAVPMQDTTKTRQLVQPKHNG